MKSYKNKKDNKESHNGDNDKERIPQIGWRGMQNSKSGPLIPYVGECKKRIDDRPAFAPTKLCVDGIFCNLVHYNDD